MATTVAPQLQTVPPQLEPVVRSCGWLRGTSYDLMYIVGTAILAIVTAFVAVYNPAWFPFLLVLDLYLLGYPHVVSTFMRIGFDKESRKEHWFLLYVLPWIVLVATVVLGFGGRVFGTEHLWVLPTIYLYWQAFHYTRQSWGITSLYSRKAGDVGKEIMPATKWSLYAVPLWGILQRSYQAQPEFLFLPVRYFPTPYWLVVAAGAFALGTVIWWAWSCFQKWQEGRLPVALVLYMLSHYTVFVVGYVVIKDITYGWLALNVWHNAQYILTVWMYNQSRFKGGVSEQHWLISLLSQKRIVNVVCYFTFCFSLSTAVYLGLSYLTNYTWLKTIPVIAIIVYQAINFHHYIVDGIIWKVRKKEIREKLGVAT